MTFDAKAARAKRPLPLWVDAFHRDTTLLETDEVGAYLKILMAMWSSRAVALPDDPRRLARAAGVSVRLWNSRIGPSLAQFFSPCAEGLTQKRLREEAAYVERSVEAQSERRSGASPESRAYAKRQVTSDASRYEPENTSKSLKINDPASTADNTTDASGDRPTQQPNNLSVRDLGGGDARADEPDQTYREGILSACSVDPISGLTGRGSARLGTRQQMIEAERWLGDLRLTQQEVIDEITNTMARKRDGPPSTLSYFTPAMERLAGSIADARTKPMEADHVQPAHRPEGGGNRLPARAAAGANAESQRIADFARVRAARRDAERGD